MLKLIGLETITFMTRVYLIVMAYTEHYIVASIYLFGLSAIVILALSMFKEKQE